jgi:uncharacterized protein YjdB
VNYNPPDTTQKGVTWSSGDTAVATVNNATGVINAVAGGSATITATSTVVPTKTADATVNVVVPITGLNLNSATLILDKGDPPYTLTPVFAPGDTTQTSITWTSRDTAVATVSGGVVTAVGGGTATITAISTADSGISAACEVTVTVPLVGISLSPNPLKVEEGSTGSFTVIYTPPDTTQKGVTWSGGDVSVATVNSATGLINAVAKGTTTITATSTVVPAKTASGDVAVTRTGAEVMSIVFKGLEDENITLNITLEQGSTLVITAPPGFDQYLWYFDDSSETAAIQSETFEVTAKPGRHSITVIVKKGGYHFSKTLTYRVGY